MTTKDFLDSSLHFGAHLDVAEERSSLLARIGGKNSSEYDKRFEQKARESIFFLSVPEDPPMENLELYATKLQARPKSSEETPSPASPRSGGGDGLMSGDSHAIQLDDSQSAYHAVATQAARSESDPSLLGEQKELLTFVPQEKQKHKLKGHLEEWDPIVESEIWMQKKDRRWKKKYLSYGNTILRKQDTKHQKSGVYKTFQIVYCDHNRRGGSSSGIVDKHFPNDKLIWLQNDREKYTFQLYTRERVYNLKCQTKEDCRRWVTRVREDLRRYYTIHEWNEKRKAAKELGTMIRNKFNYELLSYTQLLFRIANAGLFETHFFDEHSSNSMSGVMEILVEKKRLRSMDESGGGESELVTSPTFSPGSQSKEEVLLEDEKFSSVMGSVWKEFYFVLADAVLLLFKSSKAKEPSSVLALKYATVYVDEAALREGQYVWCISSPMGRFFLRAKHEVVLSEWLYAVDREIRKVKKHHSSTDILSKIYQIQTEITSMRHVMESHLGRKSLSRYLQEMRDEEALQELEIWKAILRVHGSASTPDERRKALPTLLTVLKDPKLMDRLLTKCVKVKMSRLSICPSRKKSKLESESKASERRSESHGREHGGTSGKQTTSKQIEISPDGEEEIDEGQSEDDDEEEEEEEEESEEQKKLKQLLSSHQKEKEASLLLQPPSSTSPLGSSLVSSATSSLLLKKINGIEDAEGWRLVSKNITVRLHVKHYDNFSTTSDFIALKKQLIGKWTPTSRRGSIIDDRRRSESHPSNIGVQSGSSNNHSQSRDSGEGIGVAQSSSFMKPSRGIGSGSSLGIGGSSGTSGSTLVGSKRISPVLGPLGSGTSGNTSGLGSGPGAGIIYQDSPSSSVVDSKNRNSSFKGQNSVGGGISSQRAGGGDRDSSFLLDGKDRKHGIGNGDTNTSPGALKEADLFLDIPASVQLIVEYARKGSGGPKEREQLMKKRVKLPKARNHINIGRASSNYIRIPDAGVSRTHGRIEWQTGSLVYVDLGSAYGTRLHNDYIKKCQLHIGDCLKMGKSATLTVEQRIKKKPFAELRSKCIIM